MSFIALCFHCIVDLVEFKNLTIFSSEGTAAEVCVIQLVFREEISDGFVTFSITPNCCGTASGNDCRLHIYESVRLQ